MNSGTEKSTNIKYEIANSIKIYLVCILNYNYYIKIIILKLLLCDYSKLHFFFQISEFATWLTDFPILRCPKFKLKDLLQLNSDWMPLTDFLKQKTLVV